MEFCEHDLAGFIDSRQRNLDLPEIKGIASQLLRGLDFCHRHSVLHRDVKASNVLISRQGEVKLADFGLAREFTSKSSPPELKQLGVLTSKVITLWYRPPELLLGAQTYGSEVDVWSVGAILGEMLLQKPMFAAENERMVFELIVRTVGVPPPPSPWASLPLWSSFLPRGEQIDFSQFWKEMEKGNARLRMDEWSSPSSPSPLSKGGVDLLKSLLHPDPRKRISCGQANEAAFFSEEKPLGLSPSLLSSRLPQGKACHTLTMKEEKKGKERGEREERERKGREERERRGKEERERKKRKEKKEKGEKGDEEVKRRRTAHV